MQNFAQIGDIYHYSYIAYLLFQLLRNHRILQNINYSFLYLKVLVKSELSMHGSTGHQNIVSYLTLDKQYMLTIYIYIKL